METQEKKIPNPSTQQQIAIDTYKKEGTFLVLAGPGTGKTFTVSQRIKSMIEAGIEQEKILCLTFSDAAAKEMRKKIEDTLNTADVSVNIYTFHSFCLEIIQNNPTVFYLSDNYNIITDSFSRAILKECLEDEKLYSQIKAYRDNKQNITKFIPEIKNGIDEIKKYRLNKEQFFYNLKNNPYWEPRLKELQNEFENKKNSNKACEDIETKIEKLQLKIDKMSELWLIYEHYKEKCKERNLIDFSDMIDMVLTKFEEDKDFLSEIANNYEYIMVDEYQDTNASQNAIVINLAKAQTKKNVFVVGDDDQIIYRFQGADLYTVNNFRKEFLQTETICLTENRRSTQEILDIAHEIITNSDNPNRIPKDKLVSRNDDYKNISNQINIIPFTKIEHEYDYIVNEIDELIKSDNCPKNTKNNAIKELSEIAILVSSHEEIQQIAKLLKNRGIAVQTSGSRDIFEIPASIILFLYMQFLANPRRYENKFFELLLTKPFCIHPKDYELLNGLRTSYQAMFNNEMLDYIKDNKAKFKDYEKLDKFITNYKELQQIINKENIKDTVLKIGTKSGIFAEFLNGASKTADNVEGILKIVEEADSFSKLENACNFNHFVDYLNKSCNQGIPIKTNKAEAKYNAVQVLTLHDSKGREFEYVYMPSITRGKWESKNSTEAPIPLTPKRENETLAEMEDRNTTDKLSERLRLMYVGITRAKHTLTLSYANPGKTWHTQPSKYIAPYLHGVKTKECDELQTKINSLIKFDYNDEQEMNAIIDSYLSKASFSASSLNEYMTCPRKFLYNHVLGLKARDGNFDHINLGLAVHKAYQETVNDALKSADKKYPDENVFHKYFEEEMQDKVFNSRETQQNFHLTWAKKRKQAYEHLVSSPALDPKSPEYKFMQEIEGERFSCTIDRIVCIDGKCYIHDYKTGERPDCLKNLKKNHTDYYNQMALYKYALKKHDDIDIADCILIYPFVDEESKIELPLLLSDEDCENVIEMYLDKIKDIKAHKFPAEPTNKFFGCKNCAFKEICNYYKE